jgi:hypothetical protein
MFPPLCIAVVMKVALGMAGLMPLEAIFFLQ